VNFKTQHNLYGEKVPCNGHQPMESLKIMCQQHVSLLLGDKGSWITSTVRDYQP